MFHSAYLNTKVLYKVAAAWTAIASMAVHAFYACCKIKLCPYPLRFQGQNKMQTMCDAACGFKHSCTCCIWYTSYVRDPCTPNIVCAVLMVGSQRHHLDKTKKTGQLKSRCISVFMIKRVLRYATTIWCLQHCWQVQAKHKHSKPTCSSEHR